MDNDIRLVFSRGSVIDFNSVSEVSVKYSSLGDAIAMTIKRGHGVLMVSLISNLLIGFCLFIQEPFHFFRHALGNLILNYLYLAFLQLLYDGELLSKFSRKFYSEL